MTAINDNLVDGDPSLGMQQALNTFKVYPEEGEHKTTVYECKSSTWQSDDRWDSSPECTGTEVCTRLNCNTSTEDKWSCSEAWKLHVDCYLFDYPSNFCNISIFEPNNGISTGVNGCTNYQGAEGDVSPLLKSLKNSRSQQKSST